MRTSTSVPTRSAVLLGLAFGASSMAGCDKPESGSLENAKNRKDVQAEPLDYAKLDYAKLDYAKLDYAKLDVSKLDASKLKLDEARLGKIAETNIKLVSSPTLADECLRRLNDSRVAAVEAKNDKLIADLDTIIKAVELNKSMIGDVLCW